MTKCAVCGIHLFERNGWRLYREPVCSICYHWGVNVLAWLAIKKR